MNNLNAADQDISKLLIVGLVLLVFACILAMVEEVRKP